jgi:hypothetical protein
MNGAITHHQVKNSKYPIILPITKAIVVAINKPYKYRANSCSYFILSIRALA